VACQRANGAREKGAVKLPNLRIQKMIHLETYDDPDHNLPSADNVKGVGEKVLIPRGKKGQKEGYRFFLLRSEVAKLNQASGEVR